MKNVEVRFHEIDEATVNISTDNRLYLLRHDDIGTGDWSVMCEEDAQVQGEWLMTKDDAIKYVLERIGVVEDANYQRAPDRTSA
jgi:hypothetical protein